MAARDFVPVEELGLRREPATSPSVTDAPLPDLSLAWETRTNLFGDAEH